ncbi:ubiquinol-cytochrome c reductase iron-sulfur subunit [Mucilaginibacter galii]|uniref:Iron-sulfur protein n=1 Tax=Mucilaginibacter galii TaxID=2005073 RepID=A0A917MZU6_9SPHI|nr:Rieske 2Fe-2S domain-containing protein [Mucilaginibacter galii]GGI49143.1 iron-sulfur protein [Mucilaginibacter galii]
MERKDFLSKLGITMAAVCTGCSLYSCGSDPKNDPTPGNGGGTTNPPPTSGSTLFNVNLDSELKNIGDFKVASGVILVRLAAGSVSSAFTAVQVACTHQGTSINYNTAQGKFICPNHGSQFSTGGAVLLGPATTALKAYTVAITGSNLTVAA